MAETPDYTRYQAIEFPRSDIWGLVVPSSSPMAAKKEITAEDLIGCPLFCSQQGWEHEIRQWSGRLFDRLTLEGSFRLSYNGSIFAREGLGYLLTFDRLIDTSKDSGLRFIPLYPRLETRLYLVWKKYPSFTPIAEKFLQQVQESFEKHEL